MQVIAGENDSTVPLSACQFVAERFDAQLQVIEECAHIPMDEAPYRWNKAVTSFARSREVTNFLMRRVKPWRNRRKTVRDTASPDQTQIYQ